MDILPFERSLLIGFVSLFLPISSLTSNPVLAQPTLSKPQEIVAQTIYDSNWSKVPVNNTLSVMLPGNWKYTDDGVESHFNNTYYWVGIEHFDSKDSPFDSTNFCDLMRCDNFLQLMVKEIFKDEELTSKEAKSILVSHQGSIVDGVEISFSVDDDNMQKCLFVTKTFIVNNNLYFLTVMTYDSYLDKNAQFFLNSFQL